jgi:hypothetical protein
MSPGKRKFSKPAPSCKLALNSSELFVVFGHKVGSTFGSNLPVLLVLKPRLNGVESTISAKVNSPMLYH